MKTAALFFSIFLFAPMAFAQEQKDATPPPRHIIGVDFDLEFMFYYPADINRDINNDLAGYAMTSGVADIFLCFCPGVKLNIMPIEFLGISLEARGYLAPKFIIGADTAVYLHAGASFSGGLLGFIPLNKDWKVAIGVYGGYYLAQYSNFAGAAFGGEAELMIHWRALYFGIDGRYAEIGSSSPDMKLSLSGFGIRIGSGL